MNEEAIKTDNSKRVKKSKPEKTHKRGRFNFLDALIIVSILAVIALLVFVYSPATLFGFGAEETEIIYTLRVSGVSADYASKIKLGDIITDKAGNKLGTVATDVEVQEHFVFEYTEDEYGSGGIKQIHHPDLIDLVITVSANARKVADGYEVDDRRIAVEAVYDIVLPEFESKGLCLSLSEEKISEAGGAK